MKATLTLVQVHDLDLMLREMECRIAISRLRRLGFPIGDPAPLEARRDRLLSGLEPRWLSHYERARRRYGAALSAVRSRVCQGCFVTLPRSAAPPEGDALTLCASCGRILYWG
jgi:hypothetical protein